MLKKGKKKSTKKNTSTEVFQRKIKKACKLDIKRKTTEVASNNFCDLDLVEIQLQPQQETPLV